MKSLKGYMLILGAAVFWGGSATVAKFLFTHQVDTLVLVQTRMTLSCIMLVSFFLIFRRDLLRVELKDLYKFALLGVIGGAGSNFTYYFTIKETNVATAILLQYLAPILVLAYAAVSHEEELALSKIFAGIISLGGCFLAVGGERLSFENVSHLAVLTGLTSAFCWAFTNIMLRHLFRKYNVWATLCYSFMFASIFWLFFNSPSAIIASHYSATTWKMFLWFAIISILIPHSLYFSGVRYLTASRAIITATFEPIVAILTAFFFLGEILTPLQILGAVLVISAIGVLQIRQEPAQEIPPGVSPVPGHKTPNVPPKTFDT
jgi:drug/metabolite transporter (DMT)-like permease